MKKSVGGKCTAFTQGGVVEVIATAYKIWAFRKMDFT